LEPCRYCKKLGGCDGEKKKKEGLAFLKKGGKKKGEMIWSLSHKKKESQEVFPRNQQGQVP